MTEHVADPRRARVIGLVPARSGSTRVPHKNVRPLGKHPLIAYTIAAARDSGVFDAVVVSTDDERYARIARHYGAEVPFLRPATMSGPLAPDIEWVEHALGALAADGRVYDAFSILRPTSPFRTAATIRRAWAAFCALEDADSIRAVQPCSEHPGKMWVLEGARMRPLLAGGPEDPPWHSRAYQALPPVHVQNASLEIAWARVVADEHTIAGRVLAPFLTEGHEGLDVNRPEDWDRAEALLREDRGILPPVSHPPYADEEATFPWSN